MAMVMGGVNFQGYYFCMQNDVDFASADKVDFAGGNFVAIGETSYGYSSFSGTFDGKGHTIKNMKVIRQTVTEQGLWGIANNAALFGYLKDATVKNIIIDENSAFTAQTYKASIAAQCEHSTSSGTSAGTDTWYDLNGRRLQGRPTRKGVYLRNGKKTVY